MADTAAPADRNKGPIFAELAKWLDQGWRVLEIGAGAGQHARYALECWPEIHWQTSEMPGPRLSALQHQLAGKSSLPRPLALDVLAVWPQARFDAIYAANVAHIMSQAGVQALLQGAARHLENGGLFCLYGPFFEAGKTSSASNRRFDQHLRQQNPGMGIRYIEQLQAWAGPVGLHLQAQVAMPANNQLLIWRFRLDQGGDAHG